MKRHHPIESAAVLTVAAVRLVRVVLVPVAALILLAAGYAPAPVPVPVPVPARARARAPLTVAQLRIIARQAGYKQLARSGRRVDLLQALNLAV